MSTLQIPTARVFQPLLQPSRYKGVHGGRGSGKSHFMVDMLIEDALRFPSEAGEGMRGLCFREVQKSLKDSVKALIEEKLSEFGLGEADGFKVFREVIETPGDGQLIFKGLQDHTVDSIKSLQGFHRAFGEECQSLSARSVSLLRPTIRWENKRLGLQSELWFAWNPRRKADPIDEMLRGKYLPAGTTVLQANWKDNPWFPSVLEDERQDCLRSNPDQYEHIWEGDYAKVTVGAYYAQQLTAARAEGRIGNVSADPLMSLRAVWDIGGTGAKSDACSIWIVQFVGREIRFLNYYEAQGQPLATHVNWLRANGYGHSTCFLPHDGASNDKVYDVSYESALKEAGFEVFVVPNQGKGAAMARIESSRRMFPAMWFNEAKTTAGIEAIGAYHAKKDDKRLIDLGPNHDWSSHAADSFGLVSIIYEEPKVNKPKPAPYRVRHWSAS